MIAYDPLCLVPAEELWLGLTSKGMKASRPITALHSKLYSLEHLLK